MIDCENELFTVVATRLREAFPGIYVTGETIRKSARFPCVELVQRDSAVWRNSRANDDIEHHAAVMYEANVYSNKEKTKKQQCKEIMSVLDTEMKRMGFTRTMLNPIDNLADATIYRLTARYQAIVGKNGDDYLIYRR